MRDPLFKKLEQLAEGKKKPISEAGFNLLMNEKLADLGLSLELTTEETALKDKFSASEFSSLIKGTVKDKAKAKYDSLSVEEKASLDKAINSQRALTKRGSEIAPIKKALNVEYVVFSPPEFQQVKTNQLYLVLPIAAEGTEISPRGALEQFVTGEEPNSLRIKDTAASDRPLAFLALQNGTRDDFDNLEESSPKLNAIFGEDSDDLEDYVKSVKTAYQKDSVIKKAAELIEWTDTGKVLADKRWAKLLSTPDAMLVVGKLIYRHKEFEEKFGDKFPKTIDEFISTGLEIDCPESMAKIRALDESKIPAGWSKDKLIEFAKEYYLQNQKSNSDSSGDILMEPALNAAIDIIMDPRRKTGIDTIPNITIDAKDVMKAYDKKIEEQVLPKLEALSPEAKITALENMAEARQKVADRVSKYHMRKLDKDDYRGFILGRYTSSCQSIDGHSCEVVKYGMIESDSGFFVIENERGQIKAESWVWVDESGKSIVFDSFERASSEYDSLCPLFYRAMQEKMSEHFDEVLLGKGGNTPFIDFEAGKPKRMPTREGYEYKRYGLLYEDSETVFDLKKEQQPTFQQLAEMGLPIRLLIENAEAFDIPTPIFATLAKNKIFIPFQNNALTIQKDAVPIIIKYIEEAHDKIPDVELIEVLEKAVYSEENEVVDKILRITGDRISVETISKIFITAASTSNKEIIVKLLEMSKDKITPEAVNQAFIEAAYQRMYSMDYSLKAIFGVAADKITNETFNQAFIEAAKTFTDDNLKAIFEVAADKITNETFNQAFIEATKKYNKEGLKAIFEVAADKITNETFNQAFIEAADNRIFYGDDNIKAILRVAEDKITSDALKQVIEKYPALDTIIIPIIQKRQDDVAAFTKKTQDIVAFTKTIKSSYDEANENKKFKNFKSYHNERSAITEAIAELTKESLTKLLATDDYKNVSLDSIKKHLQAKLTSDEALTKIDTFLGTNAPASGIWRYTHGIGAEKAKELFNHSELKKFFAEQIGTAVEDAKNAENAKKKNIAATKIQGSI